MNSRVYNKTLYVFLAKPVPRKDLLEFCERWTQLQPSDVDNFSNENGYMLLLPSKGKAGSERDDLFHGEKKISERLLVAKMKPHTGKLGKKLII